jgi:hypothetical protein
MGATMTLGGGVLCSVSTKQKVNACSSLEAELVGMDDIISKKLWMKLFIQEQCFKVEMNVIYHDNTSTMKLEENGKASSGKRVGRCQTKVWNVSLGFTNIVQ